MSIYVLATIDADHPRVLSDDANWSVLGQSPALSFKYPERQADHPRASFKVAKGAAFFHTQMLRNRPTMFKSISSESAPRHLSSSAGTKHLNQTGFTGEHKAWKVSHDQRKFREPFFDRSAGACSAFGA